MLLVPDPEHAFFNQHTRACFVELPNADDGVAQLGDEEDTNECMVLIVPAGEDDGADTADLDKRVITELDRALHARVQVGEDISSARHVVRCFGVEVPAIIHYLFRFSSSTKECMSIALVEVNGLLADWSRGKGRKLRHK
jgi:hypothetical protein